MASASASPLLLRVHRNWSLQSTKHPGSLRPVASHGPSCIARLYVAGENMNKPGHVDSCNNKWPAPVRVAQYGCVMHNILDPEGVTSTAPIVPKCCAAGGPLLAGDSRSLRILGAPPPAHAIPASLLLTRHHIITGHDRLAPWAHACIVSIPGSALLHTTVQQRRGLVTDVYPRPF
jgi:hypothetical protein